MNKEHTGVGVTGKKSATAKRKFTVVVSTDYGYDTRRVFAKDRKDAEEKGIQAELDAYDYADGERPETSSISVVAVFVGHPKLA
jgi:hypothetical protein